MPEPFKIPDWANAEGQLDWAKREKIITKITGESVPDYRLAVILHNFDKYLEKKIQTPRKRGV